MIPFLIGLAGIIGTVLVVTYWDEITDWLDDFVPKVEEALRDIVHGAQVLGEKIHGAYIQIKHKLFYREDEKWIEETTRRQVDESEVPPHIRKKILAQEKEADLTKELAPLIA